ncbi:unnamed protein product, partial [Effrenium voratum]
LAAPYAKVLGHPMDATNFLTVSEQLMSNSNFVLALHAGAIWFYHCFLRDHLTARHVTRIYLDRPWSEIPEALDSKGTIVATVETGTSWHQIGTLGGGAVSVGLGAGVSPFGAKGNQWKWIPP